jgi:hypothetical protein
MCWQQNVHSFSVFHYKCLMVWCRVWIHSWESHGTSCTIYWQQQIWTITIISKYSSITSAHFITQWSYNMDRDRYIHFVFTDYPKNQRWLYTHLHEKRNSVHTPDQGSTNIRMQWTIYISVSFCSSMCFPFSSLIIFSLLLPLTTDYSYLNETFISKKLLTLITYTLWNWPVLISMWNQMGKNTYLRL